MDRTGGLDIRRVERRSDGVDVFPVTGDDGVDLVGRTCVAVRHFHHVVPGGPATPGPVELSWQDGTCTVIDAAADWTLTSAPGPWTDPFAAASRTQRARLLVEDVGLWLSACLGVGHPLLRAVGMRVTGVDHVHDEVGQLTGLDLRVGAVPVRLRVSAGEIRVDGELASNVLCYDHLDAEDLRGDLVAHHLVAVEASFAITGDGRTLYAEPYFPVVELARALAAWVDRPGRGDFVFDSMSFDALGMVTIARQDGGWVVCSAATPDVRSAPTSGAGIHAAVCGFIHAVARDLRGLGFDADRILGIEGRAPEDSRPG